MSEISADDLDFAPAQARPPVIEPVGSPPASPFRTGAAAAAVAGERVISPVASRFSAGKGGKVLALVGLLAGCGVFLAATWTHPKPHKAQAATDEPVKQTVDYDAVKAPRASSPDHASATSSPPPADAATSAAPPTLAAPGQGAPSLDGETTVVPPIALSGAPQGASSAAASPAGAKTAAAQAARAQRTAQLEAIRAAPLLAYSTSSGAPSAATPGVASVRTGEPADGASSELDHLRRGSAIGLVHATRLPDRNFLLSAGAVLPCVLETALDTSAPGFVTCRVPRDVYADSGAVVLLEKGSRVIGEYRSGFAQGRARIFVLWDRITTPGGVAVDVSSPAADALGRAGFDGRIDSHFWQRFGGALLLTAVQGGLSAAATADARFASIGQAPNEAAAIALQNSVNIAPTLTKPQGAEVSIFVSRDLDFSSVYALKGR